MCLKFQSLLHLISVPMVALLHLHCCIVDSWHSIPIRLIGATAIAAFGEDERSAFYQHQCSPPDTLLTC